ncbi:DUF6701 domain-containing protein [Alkalimonas sp.]|uniref:DUF6701 domain-containing protein n=1 Tax=Alkalimonas sp. TaxID=1872453 RepID=UPI00263BC95E|nr:DUF6701 domain-containing protein [Alkalimonas sp.]MCC5826038.1 hypothetical protein [Alkalimonas sp.]
MQRLLNSCCVFLCLLFASSLWAQPNCQELYASPSGINPNLGANGISPFDLANVPWQTTPWPTSGSTLNSGSYYFGTLNTNNFYQLSIASGARVTIFVNDNLFTNNFLRLNASGNPEQLTIVVRSNVSINNQAEINGLIYAAGSININNNDVIVGGLAATGSISVGTNTVVTRDDTAIEQLELPGLCTASPVTVPDPRALYPLDLCNTLNNSVVEDLMQQYPATGYQLTPANGKVVAGANFSSAGMSRVELPSGLLNGLTDFSVSLWFKADASNSFRQILSASNNSQDTVLELYVRNNNVLRAGLLGVYYAFGSPEPVLTNNNWYHTTLTRSGNQLCLYLNANLVQCQTASAAALSVTRAALGVWWQANGTMSDPFLGDLDEVLFFSSALSARQIQTIYNNQNDGRNYDGTVRQSTCLGCFNDNFSGGVLSEDWVTSRSSGSFTPSIVDGRLRLTQAVGNQSTSVTYQRLFPAADNLVVIEFDYFAWSPATGLGADGVAVILSDANVTPQPGSFGGSLGYAQRNNGDPGFAGGWLGIGLDEWGNFSNPTEGRVGGPGFRRNAIAIRGSASNQYRYLAGTAANLSPAIDQRPSPSAAPGHRYRIVIDSRISGQALVSVERDLKTGAGFQSLVSPFNALALPGQGSVPENFFLSFTGSTGGSNNNHELDNVSICALRSLPVGVQIDHFEFDHTGQALTCQPETLTVRACLNADCSQLYTDPVTATLSPQPVPGGEWLGGHVINFSGGSTTVQLRRSTVGAVTVGVTGSVPGTRPLSSTLCRAGSGPKNTASCTLNFANSGFVLEVPDGIANQPETDVRLRAVRQNEPGQACVPAFANVSRTVQFWSDYITPDASARPVSMPLDVNNQTIGLSSAAPSAQTLAFNANGEALLRVNYADAGRVQLNARYQGANVTGDAGLVLQGATQFSKRPYGLCVQTAANCAAGNASCPAFVRAGEAFNVQLSAHAWQSGGSSICDMPVTPNFTLAGISLEHELVAPLAADGAFQGQLQPSAYQHQRSVTATSEVSAILSEVGVFRITARPSPLSYLGMTIPPAISQPVGRITPDHFALLYADIEPGCSGFSYMGQPMRWSMAVQARSLSGQRTHNYFGDFVRIPQSKQLVAEQAANGQDLSARINTAAGDFSWQFGEAVWLEQEVTFLRSSEPDGPYSQLQFGLRFQDGDSIGLDGLDMDPQSASDCVASESCTAVQLAGLQDLRYGRLTLENAFGPEDIPLPLMVRAQYWDGQRFRLSELDQCTAFSASAASVEASAGMPSITVQGPGGLLQNGQNEAQSLWLSPPMVPGFWQWQLSTDAWLQFDWKGDGVEDPSAEAVFGRYRGNPRRIFWREPLP